MVTTHTTRWKGLRVLIVSCVLLTMLPGCGWIGWVYRPVSWNQDKITRGMTKEEVVKALGKRDDWTQYKPDRATGTYYLTLDIQTKMQDRK